MAPLSLDADAYGGSGSTTTVLVAFRRALAFLDHNIKYLCAQQGAYVRAWVGCGWLLSAACAALSDLSC